MGRSASKTTPVVENDILYTDDPKATGIKVGSDHWFTWLIVAENVFSYDTITFRSERRRKYAYWYAYKKHNGALYRCYVGRAEKLTSTKLRDVAALLHRETLSD